MIGQPPSPPIHFTPGRPAAFAPLEARGGEPIETFGGGVAVRVSDRDTRQPIPGVDVFFEAIGVPWSERQTTDEEGYATARENVPDAPIEVTVEYAGRRKTQRLHKSGQFTQRFRPILVGSRIPAYMRGARMSYTMVAPDLGKFKVRRLVKYAPTVTVLRKQKELVEAAAAATARERARGAKRGFVRTLQGDHEMNGVMIAQDRRVRFSLPMGQYDNPEVPEPLITEIQQLRGVRGLGLIPFLKPGTLPPAAVVVAGVVTTGLSALGALASFRAIYKDRSTFWQVVHGALGSFLALNVIGGVLMTASGITMVWAPAPAAPAPASVEV